MDAATASLVVNSVVAVGSCAGWLFYVKAINENRNHWKDVAEGRKGEIEELEKRSPEFMEKTLEERIGVREREIERLKRDGSENEEALSIAQFEVSMLEADLGRARSFGIIANREYARNDISVGGSLEKDGIEVVLLGFASVDSGMLMVTDPCYANNWKESTDDEISEALSGTPSGGPHEYSYAGACEASSSPNGQLHFELGHPGAGVAFTTALGDGHYPVYAEKFEGDLIRVFVDLG
ncbi:hypothetical protein [Gordonia malaquae]|uniref:hypothetical protein n=1 Tax=Gordonia malaquae TaxID=410332 RepID=UPI0030FE5D0E